MKRILYICCLFSFAACTNNKLESTPAYTATPTGLQGIQQTAASSSVPNSNSSSAPTGALNPAHGAPGHRCDIAVGAPLNSGLSQTTPTTPAPQQTIPSEATSAPAVSPNTSNQKLNPKHGAPGHRCDIAVGAPLDSKPTQANAAPQISTQAATKTASPAPIPMFNEKGQKLNPEHGKPGHKCEIAVGAPLT